MFGYFPGAELLGGQAGSLAPLSCWDAIVGMTEVMLSPDHFHATCEGWTCLLLPPGLPPSSGSKPISLFTPRLHPGVGCRERFNPAPPSLAWAGGPQWPAGDPAGSSPEADPPGGPTGLQGGVRRLQALWPCTCGFPEKPWIPPELPETSKKVQL